MSKKSPTLVFTGGAMNGGLFELGFLLYFNQLVKGRVGEFSYIGTSVGSVIASALAFGATPEEMLLSLQGRSKRIPKIHPFKFYKIQPSFKELSLVNGDNIARFIAYVAKSYGASSDVRDYRGKLIVTATNMDTGKSVLFGVHQEVMHIPLPIAVQASCAIPLLFNGVTIELKRGKGTMSLYDGGISKTAHIMDTIESLDSDLVIVCNPLTPINRNKVTAKHDDILTGKIFLLEQLYRVLLESRLYLGLEVFRRRFPEKDLVLVEPDDDDMLMFRNPFFWGDGYSWFANPLVTVEVGYNTAQRYFLKNARKLRPIFKAHTMSYDVSGAPTWEDHVTSVLG